MVQYKNPINLFDSITFDWVTQRKYRGTTKTKFYETSKTNVFLITIIRRYLSIIKLCRRDVEVPRKLKDVSSKLRSLFLLVFLLAVTKTGTQFNIPKSNLSQMFSLLFFFYSYNHHTTADITLDGAVAYACIECERIKNRTLRVYIWL